MVVLWHSVFNFFTAANAGQGTTGMVMSVLIMVAAIGVVVVAGSDRLCRGAKQTAPPPVLKDAPL